MNCEDILIQKYALLDGEKTDLPAAEIDAHLESCADCRREFEQTEETILRLQRQERRAPEADLWAAVEKRIGAETAPAFAFKWQPFVLTGALLVVYKLAEMLSERDLGWAFKLVPFVLVVFLFALLKENPFKVNTELILEK